MNDIKRGEMFYISRGGESYNRSETVPVSCTLSAEPAPRAERAKTTDAFCLVLPVCSYRLWLSPAETLCNSIYKGFP